MRRLLVWLAALGLAVAMPLAPVSAGGRRRGAAKSRAGGSTAAITAAARRFAARGAGMSPGKLRVQVQAARGGYARALVIPTDGSTDPAKVYLKYAGGRWRGIAGPGTAFGRSELTRLGIPRSVQ